MNVAIIGAGNVGKALATSLSRAGHAVTITADEPENARAAAAEIGVEPAEGNAAAAEQADVVVVAVPWLVALEQVAPEIAPHVAGKVVIDVSNPLKPDYSGLATDGTSGAEELQTRLPGASVVKALNTVFASNQADPSPHIDGYVAADDAKAKQAVMSLIGSMGLKPLDVGPLSSARYLEGMAFLNISINAANGWDWTSAWKLER